MGVADPQLLRATGALVLVAAILLAGWWWMLPEGEQVARLQHLARAEQATAVPPRVVLEQPAWLATHRLARLRGMLGLLGLALVVGVSEGVAKRQRAAYGGFLLKWWTIGVVGGLMTVAAVLLFLVAPWSFGGVGVPCGLAGLVGLTGFGLGAGRPLVH